jgi:hypothetical protein
MSNAGVKELHIEEHTGFFNGRTSINYIKFKCKIGGFMVRNILGILFVFIIVNVNGNKHQDSIEAERKYKKIDPIMDQPALIIGFTHPGLFLFRASIAVGGLTKLNAGTVFFEGNTEYFIDRRVSLRGDVYFFGGHTGDYKPFKMHHSILTGAMFHKYTKGDFDPYAGIEVGINYAQATDPYLGRHRKSTCSS